MLNPIQRAMDEKGINATELAILAGVQRAWIYQLLRGDAVKLSGRVLDALNTLGYDPDELAKEYAAWRDARREVLQSRYGAVKH